jgi:hypothetical protein
VSKTTTVAIAVIFAGYTVASYGVVLLRGYDVPWRQWVNPLNPWQWKGKPPAIPPTQIWPG